MPQFEDLTREEQLERLLEAVRALASAAGRSQQIEAVLTSDRAEAEE